MNFTQMNIHGQFQYYEVKNSGFKTLIITADIPASSRRERLRMAGVSVPPKTNLRTFFQAAICPSWSINTLINGIPKLTEIDCSKPYTLMGI